MDWAAIQLALYNWVLYGSDLDPRHIAWEQQRSAARPGQPAITMRITGVENHGADWVDSEDNPLTFDPVVITSVNATLNTLTKVDHELRSGDGPVRLTTTGTLPGGLSLETNYWIVKVDDDNIKLSDTYTRSGGGNIANPITALDLNDAGTGVHTISHTTETLRTGEEIKFLARGMRKITLVLECYTATGVGIGMAQAVLAKVLGRMALPGQSDTLAAAKLSFANNERVRSINGTQGAVLFEPRAILELTFSTISEEIVDYNIIAETQVTNLDTGNVFEVPVIASSPDSWSDGFNVGFGV